jgi:preprotein translocase subunit SecA
MIDAVLAKIFGTKHEREIKAMRPLIASINDLEPSIRKLSDEELAAQTVTFREQIAQGASLDDVLVPAFAKRAAAFSRCGIAMYSSSAARCCIAAKSRR